jgi:hypothetical protein
VIERDEVNSELERDFIIIRDRMDFFSPSVDRELTGLVSCGGLQISCGLDYPVAPGRNKSYPK